jgi:FkbM family methyltransferase
LSITSPVPAVSVPKPTQSVATLFGKWGGPFRLFSRYGRARERPIGVVLRMAWLHLNRRAGRQFVFRLHGGARMKMRYDYGSPALAFYLGLYEHASMSFLLRYLRPGDVFADVGANVGVYTVLAAAVCEARVHAFEPVTSAREALIDNIALNGISDKITVHASGVGALAGTSLITTDRHGGNMIVRAGLGGQLEEVAIVTLDHAMTSASPVLVKIDVEGFEEEVLRGAPKTLADPRVNALLVEAICREPGDAERIARIVNLLECAGFHAYRFDPYSDTLSRCIGRCEFVGPDDQNLLFVRDIAEATRRLNEATVDD